MTLSFACPGCKALIEVADELTGQSGQCPRCQLVFTIPSPNQPPPVRRVEPSAPPADSWSRGSRSRSERDAPRRRVRAVPKEPSGPMWPWALGILGAIVVGGLLFSSFLVLVAWRPRQTVPQPIDFGQPAPFNNNGVRVGRLDGQRAFMQDGVFQLRSELNQNDPFDHAIPGMRCKRYDIQLFAFQDYVFEIDGNQFDTEIRLVTPNPGGGEFIERDAVANRNQRNARFDFRAPRTEWMTVYVSNNDGRFGGFTLTVRESHRPKPFVP